MLFALLPADGEGTE